MDPPPPDGSFAAQGSAGAWFCHECQWEGARPLQAPNPTCPRCSGSFLEEIDGESADDPRDFDVADDAAAVFQIDANEQGGPQFRFVLPGGGAAFIGGAAGGGGGRGPRPPGAQNAGAGGGNPAAGAGGPLGALMAAFGWGPNGAARRGAGHEDPGDPEDEPLGQEGAQGQRQPIRNLADFLANAFTPPQPHDADGAHNNPFAEGGHERNDEGQANPPPNPADPFAAFAAAMNGQQTGGGLNSLVALLNALGAGVPLAGPTGDYAFGEGAFQNILDQLAQQAGRAGPNPAPEEVIEKLPRHMVDSAFLASSDHNDCVICQEVYKLHDSILTLPCKFAHTFHQDCIIPWLSNSGTCPTCRFHLVPQPEDEPAEGSGQAGAPRPSEASRRQGEERNSAGQTAGSSSSSGSMSGAGGAGGVLPGSWPESEAERTRAASRNRERAQREVDEDDLPVLEDLD